MQIGVCRHIQCQTCNPVGAYHPCLWPSLKAQARGFAAAGVVVEKTISSAWGRICACLAIGVAPSWSISYWFRGPSNIVNLIRDQSIFSFWCCLISPWRFTAGCPYLCSQSTLVAEHRAPWDFVWPDCIFWDPVVQIFFHCWSNSTSWTDWVQLLCNLLIIRDWLSQL